MGTLFAQNCGFYTICDDGFISVCDKPAGYLFSPAAVFPGAYEQGDIFSQHMAAIVFILTLKQGKILYRDKPCGYALNGQPKGRPEENGGIILRKYYGAVRIALVGVKEKVCALFKMLWV